MTTTRRWRIGLLATVALVGVGLLFAEPTLLAAAVIPLGFVLYGALATLSYDGALSARRTLEPATPGPGERVRVELTIEHTGETTLPDVRVIDGVPDELAVVNGSPRAGGTLSPGETMTVEYELVSTRGEFHFEEPLVRLRSISAAAQETATVPVDGEETLSCVTAVGESPFQRVTLPRPGTMPSDTGGSGIEFFATRTYRPGDPATRIDWHHYAKTGEFITIQFREEQAPQTVVVVDARPVGRVVSAPGYPSGASLAAYVGERIHEALCNAGVVTGVAAVGLEAKRFDRLVGPADLAWSAPGGDRSSDTQAEAIFEAVHRVATVDATTLSTGSPSTPSRPGDDLTGSPSTSSRPDDDSTGSPSTSSRPDDDSTGSPSTSSRPDDDRHDWWIDGDADDASTAERSPVGLSNDVMVTGATPGGHQSGLPHPRRAVPGAGREATDGESNPSGQPLADDSIRQLLSRLPASAQVVICTPLLDDWPVALARVLATQGYSVVTISPDVVDSDTVGQRIGALYRSQRLRQLDELGVTVDWDPELSVDYALLTSIPRLLAQQ